MMSCYMEHEGCRNCEHENDNQSEYPCAVCTNNYTDMYVPKKDMVEVIRCSGCVFWVEKRDVQGMEQVRYGDHMEGRILL